MSFLRKSKSRRAKGPRALVTVFALVGFQALAIVGAGSALAVTACTFNPGTGAINITIDPAGTPAVAVETAAANLDAAAPAGAILFSVTGGAPWLACGSATNTNTTSITVLGSPSSDETFTIDNNVLAAGTSGEFNTAITWALDLGSGTADRFVINAGDAATGDTIVLTNTSFTLNGSGGPVLGMELATLNGNDDDDVLDGSALTSVLVTLNGGDGDDVLSPGVTTGAQLAASGDFVNGGLGIDTVSYATATTSQCIVIDNPTLFPGSGLDANCDGDIADAGDAADSLVDFLEILQSGHGNDTLIGAGLAEAFVPGDGNDDVTGAPIDTIDWSSSSAAMLITPALETATGQGSDTFDGPANFIGSPFDDVLIWDTAATTTSFVGGDGKDTVDASAKTSGQTINLDLLDDGVAPLGPFVADSLENAIGGSGNDSLIGNDLRNKLDGGDGDDTLTGAAGNDTLIGRAGNDTYSGGLGADKVSFRFSPNGVTVDASLGFASGEGDDSLAGSEEIFIGSNHNDNMTGGGGAVAINFRFNGRGGKDILTGSGSNDVLKGGRANDVLRGAAGDDTLLGGPGKKDRGFGGSGVDVCRGTEIEKSCEV